MRSAIIPFLIAVTVAPSSAAVDRVGDQAQAASKPDVRVSAVVRDMKADDAITTEDVLNLRAGESINGFPNWQERVLHQWMNRARVDPQFEMALCGAGCAEAKCYTAMPPLLWSEALNRAARFHADEMLNQQFFGHNSKCTLVDNISSIYPAGCNGASSCACAGGNPDCSASGCTAWYQRVGLFGTGARGEVIAAGTDDPDGLFYLWLQEFTTSATCGAGALNIHRWLILQSTGAVGAGANEINMVADFGSGGTPYKVPSGAHYPQQAPFVEMWANWYDAAPPKSAAVVVDGVCTPMTLRRGTPQNGAWSATVSGVGSGCHRYYFVFTDSTGAVVTYPATGTLGIGNDACTEWNSTRQSSSCDTTRPTRRRGVRR